ncbi:MAG: Cell surface protein [Candidatus Jettenia ecosi]|uniref:Cell surface protein n=1 Tax=Candidatus Jettenia ecosi TaxID=2494326 RepID=A0A533QK81_9BACT|nr:MAG: Cell surface protein [Candidatus Jettenia ecosi]
MFGTGVPHLLYYGFKEEGLEMNRQVRIYSSWLMSMLFLLSGVPNKYMTAYGQPVQSEKPVSDQSGRYNDTATSKGVDEAVKAKAEENYGKLPLYFIRNDGQADEKVRFYERGIGHTTSFTPKGVYLSLAPASQSPLSHESTQFSPSYKFTNSPPSTEFPSSHPFTKSPFSKGGQRGITKDNSPHNPQKETRTNQFVHATQPETIKLIPLGANKDPLIIPEGLQEAKVNYFIDKNPEDWKTNISTYQAILYKDIYQDIDMRFYGNNRQLEYDIIVKPGANPSWVQLSYQGIEDLKVTEEGDLEIGLKDGKLIQKRPYVYQEIEGKRVERKGEFKVSRLESKVQNLKHKTRNSKHFIYAFQVASYDKRYPLVIDPILEYSTYLGGSGLDSGRGIAVDTAGNVYVTGGTYSFDFPTANALDKKGNKEGDVFITKMNAAGTSLIYSTYLGGNDGGEYGAGIAVDAARNVYIVGNTTSFYFPTFNAFDESYNGGGDIFVAKINAAGTNIIYSTYLGGSGGEWSYGMAIDASGNVYITGEVQSGDFPTVNAFDESFGPGHEAFVTKMNADGKSLIYSTYLGTSATLGNGIAADAFGNAYVTGRTYGIPLVNALDETNFGGEAFVTKINTDGSNLIYSTYLGGSSGDDGTGIAVDADGNAYITGRTSSDDFPTVNAIDGSLNGSGDAFVTKINAAGTSLIYSTYFGGSDGENNIKIAIDADRNVYITGSTFSGDLPTVNALDGNLNGKSDLFVTKMNAAGTSLIFSTYFGGGSDYYPYDGDSVSGIAVDTVGNAYITGWTGLYDFPIVNAFDASLIGRDAFITKILFVTKIPSDLQVRYTCNEGGGTMVTDSSVNGNNGIIEGATWTTGREEGGLSFDGIDDAVSIPLINNEELSVCAWFYKNVNDTTNTDAIFGGARWNADPQLREGFDVRFIPSAPDTLRFVLTTQDTSGVRTTKEAQAKSLNSVGSWYHVAGTYNKTTGEQKLYINGQLVDTKIHPAGNTAVPLSYSEMKIGYSKYGTGYFNGIIDDVRLYRQALSDKEVQGIYHAVTSGMQIHYAFDEGTGTIAHDASGNDNHGEIQGAVWTAGKSGNGLSFDGINDSVSVPRMNHDKISLSAWFRKNANDTSRADAIFSGLRWSSDPQLREGFDVRFSPGSPDTLRYALVTMDGSGNKTTKTVKENLVNSVNTWYHVVCTYNMATGKQHLYVNGQLVDTDTHPAGNTIVPLTYYDDIRVGYSRYKTGYFNGLIDEVRLYQRALSDQEVQELYTNN